MNTFCKRILAAGLLVLSTTIMPVWAADSPAKAVKSGFSEAELKKMSVFLSNFTELGYMDIVASEFFAADNTPNILHFGVWHNYVNNYKSRIVPCKTKNCQWGSLTIEPKYVSETLKKYFGKDIKHDSKKPDETFHYDGKLYHFEGADGEANYFAKVQKAEKTADGLITMTGILYNTEDNSDILGTFEATARPQTYNGKPTWIIESLKSTITQ